MRYWPVRVPEAVGARARDAAFVVAALFVGGVASDSTEVSASSFAELNEMVGMATSLALLWRRRAPLVVAGLAFAAVAIAPMAAGASIMSVFNLAAHGRDRAPVVVAVLAGLYVAAGVVGMILFPDQDMGTVASALAGIVLTLAAVGWGLAVRSRRDLMASLAERAERAESEQHARLAEARRAERTRIATEMHDVLAHRLSMLSLQAGAIELRPGSSPDDLARAAGVVRSSAHLALEELRTVIGVLRHDEVADSAPQPTVADLDALVEECRAAGMRVDLDLTDGSLPSAALPPDLGPHAYRIVQEGLTNARKHAPGRPVRLVVTSRPGEGLSVEITNPVTSSSDSVIPGAGVGLVGLRERVELVGGTLERGTDEAGTHRLRAWLPWPT